MARPACTSSTAPALKDFHLARLSQLSHIYPNPNPNPNPDPDPDMGAVNDSAASQLDLLASDEMGSFASA